MCPPWRKGVELEITGVAYDEPGLPGRAYRITQGEAGSVGTGRRRAAIDREQADAIREWARRNNLRIAPTRGRIPADIVDRFIRANSPNS